MSLVRIQKLARAVVHVVLVVLLAGSDELQLRRGTVRGEVAHLGRRMAGGLDEDHLAVPRLPYGDVEALVLLLIEEVVFGFSEDVAEDLVRALGLRMLDSVDQGLAVFRPVEARHAGDRLRPELSRAEVLDVQRELPEAGLVRVIGEKVAVRADDGAPAHGHERLAFRELIDVEDHFFRRLQRSLLAAIDRVLLPFLRARVIEITAIQEWDVDVRLLDAPQHLVVELLLQRLRGLHEVFRIGQLGLQIRLHLRCALVAQPVVVVGERLAVDLRGVRDLLGDRGGRRHRSRGRRRHQRGEAENGPEVSEDESGAGTDHGSSWRRFQRRSLADGGPGAPATGPQLLVVAPTMVDLEAGAVIQ